MPPAVSTPLALVVIAALLRLVPGPPAEERWAWSRDLPLLLLAGPALAALAWWLGAYHVPAGYSVSDFPEHCAAVAAGARGDWASWTQNRSVLVGLPSVWAARRVGVIDGLLLGSIAGTAVVGVGLYLWARALHGRLAGVAAVLLAPAVAPVALLARTLNFYPTTTGVLVLASALAAVAVRWRARLPALALGGTGVGLALLADVRGFVWGLALLPAVLGGALLARPRALPARLAAVLLPVWLSFQAGPWAFPDDHTPLEVQANVVRMLRERNDPAHYRFGGWDPVDGFVWGRSPLGEVPGTVRTLLYYREVAAARSQREAAEENRLRHQVRPWQALYGAMAALAAWTLRRRPLLLLALVATAAPFYASWQGAIGIQRAHLRFLSSSMPFVALLLGLSAAALAVGAVPTPFRPQPGAPPRGARRDLRLPVACAVVLLLVLGIAPGWLSPVAPWRHTVVHEDGGVAELWGQLGAREPNPRDAACVAALREELAAGRPRWITPVDGRMVPLVPPGGAR